MIGVDDRAGVVARVLKEGGDRRLVLGEMKGELGGRQVVGAPGADDPAEGRILGVVDAVVGAEEPDAVLDQEAAEIGAVILLGETGDGAVARRHRLRLGLQRVVVVVAEGVAVERIAARLGDHVDDGAGRAAELRRIAAALDVDRLDELEVELLALEAVFAAGGVDAVDEEDVLVAARAVGGDRRLVGVFGIGVGADAGGDLHHRRVVAPGRQGLDRAGVEVGADRRRGDVDHRHFAGDRDRFGDRRVQRGVDRGLLVEVHRHRRAVLRREPLEGDRDAVGARRQQGQPVAPGAVAGRGPRPLQGRAAHLDRHPRQRASLLVGDPADDAARRLGRRRRRADDRHPQPGAYRRQRDQRRRRRLPGWQPPAVAAQLS